jgi:hypothetical protein
MDDEQERGSRLPLPDDEYSSLGPLADDSPLPVRTKRGTRIAPPDANRTAAKPAALLTSSLPLRAEAIDSRASAVSDVILRITSQTTGANAQVPVPAGAATLV